MVSTEKSKAAQSQRSQSQSQTRGDSCCSPRSQASSEAASSTCPSQYRSTSSVTCSSESDYSSANFDDNFELTGKILGAGGSGKVYQAVCRRTGKAVAVKSFHLRRMSPKQRIGLLKEIETMSKVSHPSIVRLQGLFESDDKVHLVLDHHRGGDIFNRLRTIGPMGETSPARYIAQVLGALAYLHRAGIVHRDIKPENVMFEDRVGAQVKLIDFGLAAFFEQNVPMKQVCGTLQYVAPEVIARKPYDEKADIWSCGSLLYTMMTGKVLYTGNHATVTKKNKRGAVEYSSVFRRLSHQAQDFVRRLLQPDPSRRPSALEALRDPWLRKLAGDEVDAALNHLEQMDQDLTEVVAVPPSLREKVAVNSSNYMLVALSHFSTDHLWKSLAVAAENFKQNLFSNFL